MDRNVLVETYGCQMNEYDSGIVRSLFHDRGYRAVSSEAEAGVILLNTCAVREKAQERVYGRLQNLAHLKRKNSRLVIGVLGCMAQNLGEDLYAMGLPVDLILGPDNYRDLPARVEALRRDPGSRFQLTRISTSETYEDLEPEVVHGPLAFVTVMRGCNNFCSFCVVPYTRGRERSRDPETIVREIRHLIERRDVREVTLLGQNVNSYRHDGIGFAALVERILAETDVKRLRFTSPHPRDFPEELLQVMGQSRRFCSSIHLPVQSGSDEVLRRMRRDYSSNDYRALVRRIREAVPDVGLTTDVIVGFPGETEEDFGRTLALVDEVGFDMAYMFQYSQREHASAKRLYPDDVPEAVKLDRLNRLINVQMSGQVKRNAADHGRTFEVLVEGPSKKSSSEWMGRTESGKVVVFSVGAAGGSSHTSSISSSPSPSPSPSQLLSVSPLPAAQPPSTGDLVPVLIESSTQATLRGRWIRSGRPATIEPAS